MAEDTPEEINRKAYAIVGELVLTSNALDYLLTDAVIAVMDLEHTPLLFPVVHTLDPSRKIEMLKSRAKLVEKPDWRKGIEAFTDKVEAVFKFRNIACHATPKLEDGKWFLTGLSAAKIFKNIDLEEKVAKPTPIEDLQAAIKVAEDALGKGQNVVNNFKNLNAEMRKRGKPEPSPATSV